MSRSALEGARRHIVRNLPCHTPPIGHSMVPCLVVPLPSPGVVERVLEAKGAGSVQKAGPRRVFEGSPTVLRESQQENHHETKT